MDEERIAIEQVRNGQTEAFAILVRKHQAMIRGYCVATLSNTSEADDAAQEIFIKAYRSLARFRGAARFSTWLYRIAVNHCRDLLRKRSRMGNVQSWEALQEQNGERAEAQVLAAAVPSGLTQEDRHAVQEALSRFEATPEDLLVIVDDIQLPLGRIRIRRQGSDGGHNGLLSIIETLGTPAFSRLRLGIGGPPEGEAMIDFVLGAFEPHEREAVVEMVGRATDALRVVLREGLEKAMNQFNKSDSIV